MNPLYTVLLISLLASIAAAVVRARQRRFLQSDEGKQSSLDNLERAKAMLRDGEQLIVADVIPKYDDFVLLTDRRIYHKNNKGRVFEADYAHIDKLKLTDMTGSKVKNPAQAAIAKLKSTSGDKCTLSYAFPQFSRIAEELQRRAG